MFRGRLVGTVDSGFRDRGIDRPDDGRRRARAMKSLVLPPHFRAAATLLGPPVAVLAGGFALVLAISSDPILAYRDLLFANFYSAGNFALFINRMTPLLFLGLSVILSFRAGVFNVGGEGQLYLGAMAATIAGLACAGAPRPLGLVLAAAAGAATGAVYALAPALMKVRLGVNEVVSTLMLNFVALLLTQYLATHPLARPRRLWRGKLDVAGVRLAS